MPRIADVLDRESLTVDLEQGDFERLLARRERKQRSRQIRAGVVGVVVALAAVAFLVRAIRLEVTPANPNPPKPIGSEVLYGSSGLSARDPNGGAARTVVDAKVIPERAGIITAAAWSFDRKWVAFRTSPGGGSQDGSIWVADAAGGAPRRIGPDGRWTPWVWSPTADQLAVVRGREAILIDAATGRETDLGPTAGLTDFDGYAVQAMTWSPDGTQIAYSRGSGGGSVYSIDVESGAHSLLVRQPAGAGSVIDIDWSPDGEHLAITYEDVSRHIAGSFPDSLYLANADGSGTHLVGRDVAVAGGSWPDWYPGLAVGSAWSPDGTRLAYSSFTGRDHQNIQLWTVPADLSTPSLITTQCCGGGAVVWSPDGSHLALLTERGSGSISEIRHYLVVDAEGTGAVAEGSELTYRSWADGWYFCFCYG